MLFLKPRNAVPFIVDNKALKIFNEARNKSLFLDFVPQEFFILRAPQINVIYF
jgi:hypothetical protein